MRCRASKATGCVWKLEIASLVISRLILATQKSSLSRHNAKATDRTVFAAILQITMGVFNATSEPRQATADDSLAGRCESAFGECPDVDWFP
jgi:hypothetical protein